MDKRIGIDQNQYKASCFYLFLHVTIKQSDNTRFHFSCDMRIHIGGTQVRWFDNKEEAQVFTARDYSDNVKTHSIKNAARIEEIETRIAQQEYEAI